MRKRWPCKKLSSPPMVFGTVTIDDEVYAELTRAMSEVNAEAEDLHAAAEAD